MSVWSDLHNLEMALEREGLGEKFEALVGELRIAIEDLDGDVDEAREERDDSKKEAELAVGEAKEEAQTLYELLEQLGIERRDVEVAMGHFEPTRVLCGVLP